MTVSKMANFKRKKILNNSIFKIKLSITIKNQSKKIKDNKSSKMQVKYKCNIF